MTNKWIQEPIQRFGGYGSGGWSMPESTLVDKMEATDPSFINAVEAYTPDESYAKDYIRREIIDRTPDTPWMESEPPLTPGVAARQNLDTRYKGGRYDTVNRPRHPDLFIGFTGNDPRGMTNNPRLDLMNRMTYNRQYELTARMGKNDDNQLAERPWTNQSISYAMKQGLERTRKMLKIFTRSKENFVRGNNINFQNANARPVRELLYSQDGNVAPGASEGVQEISGRGKVVYRRDAWKHADIDENLDIGQYDQSTVGYGIPARDTRSMLQKNSNEDLQADNIATNRATQALGASMALATRVATLKKKGVSDDEIKSMMDKSLQSNAMLRQLSTPKGDVVGVWRQGQVDPGIIQSPIAMIQSMMRAMGTPNPEGGQPLANMVREGAPRIYEEMDGRASHLGTPSGDPNIALSRPMTEFLPSSVGEKTVRNYKTSLPQLNKHIADVSHFDGQYGDNAGYREGKRGERKMTPHQARVAAQNVMFVASHDARQGKQRGAPTLQYVQHDTNYDQDTGQNLEQFAGPGGAALGGKNLRPGRGWDESENTAAAVGDSEEGEKFYVKYK